LFVVCSVVVESLLSGWLVATRNLPRNLAHAHISHSLQGFYPSMRTVVCHIAEHCIPKKQHGGTEGSYEMLQSIWQLRILIF